MPSPVYDLTKVEVIAQAWERMRPEKTFCGISLEQLKLLIEACMAARAEIKNLRARKQAANKGRLTADSALRGAVRKVIRGVQGDPNEGEDGELYGAMGFVPLSQRQPRRRRRVKAGTEEV